MLYHRVIVFIICLLFFGCRDDAKNIKSPTRSMTLVLPGQNAESKIRYIEVTAEIKIIEEQIYTKRSGEIEKIYVQIGDTVKVNNILASFESEKLKSEITQIKILVNKEKDQVIRNNELYAKKLISKKDFDEQAKKYNQLRKSYEESLEHLKNSVLYAPVDGVVKMVQIDTKMMVGKRERAFIITRLDSVNVNCTFTESILPELSIGDDLKLKENAGEENIYSAKIMTVIGSEEKTGKSGGIVLRVKRNAMPYIN